MTYLQAINKVLLRLREDSVEDLSDNYTQLIGEFVNETKREVEDSWDWVQLRTTIQVATVADQLRYTLTGSGDRARILYVNNDTDNFKVHVANSEWLTGLLTLGTTPTGSPNLYDVNGNTNGDYNVDLYPIADGAYSVNFNMVVPQDDLTSISETITVPNYPVVLGAYAKAIAERGEDAGLSYRDALVNAEKALQDAIAFDAALVPSEMVWSAE